MSYYFKDVQRFHAKFGLVTPDQFSTLSPDLLKFRVNFLYEEWQEYVDSCATNDLATAIDSLLDLVYVACGTAILHGITAKEWAEVCVDEDDLYNVEELVFNTHDEPLHLRPSFLSPEVNVKFTTHLEKLIDKYSVAQNSHDEDTQYEVSRCLAAIYVSVLAGAAYLGMSPECWDEFWDDVQRANMSKERVLRAEDSKRGSTYDVRKPTGWIPPDSEGLLAKWST